MHPPLKNYWGDASPPGFTPLLEDNHIACFKESSFGGSFLGFRTSSHHAKNAAKQLNINAQARKPQKHHTLIK